MCSCEQYWSGYGVEANREAAVSPASESSWQLHWISNSILMDFFLLLLFICCCHAIVLNFLFNFSPSSPFYGSLCFYNSFAVRAYFTFSANALYSNSSGSAVRQQPIIICTLKLNATIAYVAVHRHATAAPVTLSLRPNRHRLHFPLPHFAHFRPPLYVFNGSSQHPSKHVTGISLRAYFN